MSMHLKVVLMLCLITVLCDGFVFQRQVLRNFELYGGRFLEPKVPKTTKRYCSTRAGKKEIILDLTELLRRSKVLLRYTYKRFTPNERLKLNKRLKPFTKKGADGSEESGKLRIVKNTLMEIAMANTEWEVFAPRMHGPSMCFFIFNEEKLPSILAAIEKLRGSDKKIRLHISLESASYAGKVIEPLDLFGLANYSSKNELVARLMCAISGSTKQIASGLNCISTRLAIALNEVAKPQDQPGSQQHEQIQADETNVIIPSPEQAVKG